MGNIGTKELLVVSEIYESKYKKDSNVTSSSFVWLIMTARKESLDNYVNEGNDNVGGV